MRAARCTPALRARLATDGFRALVALCFAATVVITWPLWQRRAAPPLLPLLPLPQCSLGAALIAATAWAALRPRHGVPAHVLVLLYAFAADETRIQPFVVSLAILLWGASAQPTLRLAARAHLIALWLWSGLHKALSPEFFRNAAPWLLTGLWPRAPASLQSHIGALIVAAEVGTGLLALAPRTRRAAAVVAFAMHAVIVAAISRPALGRNPALWPWGVALAAAGLALIAPWRERWRDTVRAHSPGALALAALLLVAPAGYYTGWIGPTHAHVLYTGAAASTVWCDAADVCSSDVEQHEAMRALRVMIPAEPRILRRAFLARCRPGERMILHDPVRDRGAARPYLLEVPCPSAETR